MKQPGCNHQSKKCTCYDFTDPKWKRILQQSRDNDGMTLQEIGDIMGTTRMAICTQEKRLLKKMKDLLKARGLDEETIKLD